MCFYAETSIGLDPGAGARLGLYRPGSAAPCPQALPEPDLQRNNSDLHSVSSGGQCYRYNIHDGQAVAGGHLSQDLDSQRNRIGILEQDRNRDQRQDL